MTKAKDLRDLSLDELVANCEDERKKLYMLVNEKKQTRQFEKPHRIPQAKKEIARMLTIISEKQMANG